MTKDIVHQVDTVITAVRACCESRSTWCLLGFSSLYLLLTASIATQRMLWNDELFTLYLSQLGNLSDMLAALSKGADQNPPSFYVLTHGILSLLGQSELAVRLPEVLGVLLMCLCLFRFVSRRSGALYGFAAMLFPLITTAYEYAYEARPYGLVLGFSSLALLCWQEATDGSRRGLWLLSLATSGVAAVSSHYYGVFLLIPLGIGELVRSLIHRRVDPPIWMAIGGMVAPLLLFLPFIQQASTYSHHFWAQPEWRMIPGFYYFLLTPAIGPIVATWIVASLWPIRDSELWPPSLHEAPRWPWPEIAAAFGFVLIPVIAVILAKFVTGAFTYRYALSAVIGFSILCAIAAQRMDGGRAIMGCCLVLFSCTWFVATGVIQMKQQAVIAASWSKSYKFLQSEGDQVLPIVAADLHTFMTLAHYAPPSLSSRVVYLADPQASIRHLGHDTVDRGILDLKPWFHVAAEEYAPYLASHSRFLVYTRVRGDRSWLGCYWGQPWNLSWLLYELHRAPVRIELRGRNDDDLLFLVTSSSGQERSAERHDQPSAMPRMAMSDETPQPPCQR